MKLKNSKIVLDETYLFFKKGSIGMNEPQVLLEKSSTKKESSHSKIMENFLFVKKKYLQNFSTKRKKSKLVCFS